METVRTAASALNVLLEVFEVSRPADLEGVFQVTSYGRSDAFLAAVR